MLFYDESIKTFMQSAAQATGLYVLGNVLLLSGFMLVSWETCVGITQPVNIIVVDSPWVYIGYTMQVIGALVFVTGMFTIIVKKFC
jgi:hypothetical protein